MKFKITRFLAVCFILIMGACAACSSAQLPAYHPAENYAIDRAVRSTIVLNDLTGDWICGGTQISPKQIVTAYHCAVAAVLTEEEQIEATIEDGQIVVRDIDPAEVDPSRIVMKSVTYTTFAQNASKGTKKPHKGWFIAADPKHDVALIETETVEDTYTPLSSSDLRHGQKVFAIGHPIGLKYSYSAGVVAMPCRERYDVCWHQIDIHILPGSSGGGLFNEAGELVGAAAFGLSSSRGIISGYSFFVYTDAIRKLTNF